MLRNNTICFVFFKYFFVAGPCLLLSDIALVGVLSV